MAPVDAWMARSFGFGAAGVPNHPAVQWLAIIVMSLGVAWTTVDIDRPGLKGLIAVAALAEVFTAAPLLALFGVFFSPVLPAAAGVLAFGGGFAYARSQLGRRQRQVDAAFGRRVSWRHERELVDGRAVLDSPGEMDELTLVVCEVLNQQRLMEALQPGQYVNWINRFLGAAAEAVVESGGCLAACDGEGVRGVYGAPLPTPSHAVDACRGALNLAKQIKVLNEEMAREHRGLICDMRIGINSGEMATGDFGSARLRGFSVSGEEAAFARRLCAANLVYGSTILIGARTFGLAEAAIEARPLELLRRRIGDHWLEVYELLGEPHDLSPQDLVRRDLFWTGVIFYREKRLADALEKFSQARSENGVVDGPVDFYIHRIKELQHSKTTADWETSRLLNAL